MDRNHILIFVYWSIYYLFHSLLITDWVKLKLRQIGWSLNLWRIFYSVISSLGFLLLLFHLATVKSPYLFPISTVSKFFALVFTTYGVIIIRLSFRNYSILEFLTKDDRFEKSELLTHGIHKKIRHPLYAGTILIVLGMAIFVPKLSTLIVVGCTAIYLVIGIWLEEKKLIRKYGQKYLDYKKSVPSLIPRLFYKKH